MSDESFIKCPEEYVEQIIDEVMLIKKKPHEVITRMLEKLLDTVPYEVLMEEKSLETICQKIEESIEKEELEPEELKKSVESIPSFYKEQMEAILNIILERVFGSGIDYLYIMKF